ncbi:MAG: UvrD-helicase domain-containing protein [Candidatus Saccharicenans sp.]
MIGEKILPKDNEIRLPEFILLKASAGTGKTHALTLRYTQFLLSEKIRNNSLPQILAITFTRNAAREMKLRIINWLKECYFESRPETIAQILELVSCPKEQLKNRAEKVLESILNNYTDFQVMTIDSFMADVFKASAVELGVNPDFEITLDSTPVINYAYSRLLRRATAGSPEGNLLLEISDSLKDWRTSEASFIWDPSTEILSAFLEFYHRLEASNRRPLIRDLNLCKKELERVEKKWRLHLEKLRQFLEKTSLTKNERSTILKKINSNRINDWVDCSFKTIPVKKPSSPGKLNEYKKIEQLCWKLENDLENYKNIFARNYFQPHLQVYHQLLELLHSAQKERGLIFLEDIQKQLSDYLDLGVVPDIYFCLGSTIYHYLIDEFQDTSPPQWQNLKPLIENALSQGGSLFIVGDTKQAIYGFREADYQIMADFIEGRQNFPSVRTEVRELQINRRSKKKLLEFISQIFPGGIEAIPDDEGKLSSFKAAGHKSGLNNFTCLPAEESSEESENGYFEIELLGPPQKESHSEENQNEEVSSSEDEIEAEEQPEKKKLQEVIQELIDRGYDYSELAILTYKNQTVVEIASWLNEINIPFVPFSSLDIRERPLIREILSFLQFLDFPLDDLNFSVFLYGQLLQKNFLADSPDLTLDKLREYIIETRLNPQTRNRPLYTLIRDAFPDIWEKYLDPFFKTAGYLPLYELVSQIYRTYRPLVLFPEEQGALIKLLEVIKIFEGQGKSNLREFIKFSQSPVDDESIWTVDVPEEIPAVRIMTIHKAKGLGFPVVILLLYPEYPHYPAFYLLDSGQRERNTPVVEVLKLNQKIIAGQEDFKKAYEDYDLKDKVNRLNTLYVALTRAKRELYIIGSTGKRKIYPFNFLEKAGLKLDQKHQSSPLKPPFVKKEKTLKKDRAKGFGLLKPELKFWTTGSKPAVAGRLNLNYFEQKKGQWLHLLLQEIEYLNQPVDSLINDIILRWPQPEFSVSQIQELAEKLRVFLSFPQVEEYFRPAAGRQVLREAELVNSEGQLYRVDRVVIDPELVTIIDFKTSYPEAPEIIEQYKKQVINYRNILKEIYPHHTIKAILMYLDRGYLEEIK